MYEQPNIENEGQLHKYTYRDALKDEVVFECVAKNIEEADKQYQEKIGKDPSKQNNIGCSIKSRVDKTIDDTQNVSEKSPKQPELIKLKEIKKVSRGLNLFRSTIKGFEEIDVKRKKADSEKKRKENTDEILGRKKSSESED